MQPHQHINPVTHAIAYPGHIMVTQPETHPEHKVKVGHDLDAGGQVLHVAVARVASPGIVVGAARVVGPEILGCWQASQLCALDDQKDDRAHQHHEALQLFGSVCCRFLCRFQQLKGFLVGSTCHVDTGSRPGPAAYSTQQ